MQTDVDTISEDEDIVLITIEQDDGESSQLCALNALEAVVSQFGEVKGVGILDGKPTVSTSAETAERFRRAYASRQRSTDADAAAEGDDNKADKEAEV